MQLLWIICLKKPYKENTLFDGIKFVSILIDAIKITMLLKNLKLNAIHELEDLYRS